VWAAVIDQRRICSGCWQAQINGIGSVFVIAGRDPAIRGNGAI